MPIEYKNFLQLKEPVEGKELQIQHLTDILKNGSFLPNTVVYKDIDDAFKVWVENELKITDFNGKDFPTIVLYSNQRFSEYTQSWKYTDSNNNILLNFKSITRENNPQYGTIQNRFWNIPGIERFFTMKKQIVLDDNGSESLLVLKMKQPTAIDINYKLSIFTTQYESINDFNILINKLFNARQCYIKPNEHYMPMVLDGINDESSYNIDDRQFYGQTYQIKVLGYIITEDDYRVEEIPLKSGISIPMLNSKKYIPEVEIEECEEDGKEKITIVFPSKTPRNTALFIMDTDFLIQKIETENVFNNYKIFKDDVQQEKNIPLLLKENETIKFVVSKQEKNKEAKIVLFS